MTKLYANPVLIQVLMDVLNAILVFCRKAHAKPHVVMRILISLRIIFV
jgi:hypothetical protein